jgi:hypothetical protein
VRPARAPGPRGARNRSSCRAVRTADRRPWRVPIQRVGEILFPIVAVGINREVLEVDDVRDMQIRVQRCRQLDREAQGVMAGRTPVEPDHHMAGRAKCRGGSLNALRPTRIGQHLFHRRVLPILVIGSSSQPGHRQTRRCGGDGDQQGADRIGHPGPIAAALNQSDRFDAAVLNVV